MLNYTFSTREKVMIAILAFVAVGLVWYRFIFVGTADQINSLEMQIQQTQDEALTLQAQAQAINAIKQDLEKLQSSGKKPTKIPDYDNTEKLMAFLNGVVGGANGYSITFEDPELGEVDQYVHRNGIIQFGCGSYEEARTVVLAIAEGPYPCEVTDLAMVDRVAGGQSGSTTGAPYETTMAVTFFERPSEDMVPSEGDNIPEGNDWSVYMDK